uniref:Rad21/Rec8-like protein N-terminal domain-containing protein n=1 Tax=Chromera velia CCMP2878 TaxID=1169474 RepID=A0A0G4FWG1_9ALVE|eukprot:Cvel_18980.t1-p1 / transcript=Cvel_18980.t1 / gene=Cvel_18980 / organism=Chromera_velia_CCMP2878 / gene_product=Cohesin subunit rad21, putative / transcript_product=Cohesin subunit rad21, putative / location=Cvel_scaffold1605:611-3126(-) / protein_length=759 / sequence_SO=supercontig / SO=protein_coding / is_pseudo=false
MSSLSSIWSPQGVLGTVYLAAYHEKKLKERDVLDADLRASLDQLLSAEMPRMNLRLSSGAMIGVIRIFSKKAFHLQKELEEVLEKIRANARLGGAGGRGVEGGRAGAAAQNDEEADASQGREGRAGGQGTDLLLLGAGDIDIFSLDLSQQIPSALSERPVRNRERDEQRERRSSLHTQELPGFPHDRGIGLGDLDILGIGGDDGMLLDWMDQDDLGPSGGGLGEGMRFSEFPPEFDSEEGDGEGEGDEGMEGLLEGGEGDGGEGGGGAAAAGAVGDAERGDPMGLDAPPPPEVPVSPLGDEVDGGGGMEWEEMDEDRERRLPENPAAAAAAAAAAGPPLEEGRDGRVSDVISDIGSDFEGDGPVAAAQEDPDDAPGDGKKRKRPPPSQYMGLVDAPGATQIPWETMDAWKQEEKRKMHLRPLFGPRLHVPFLPRYPAPISFLPPRLFAFLNMTGDSSKVSGPMVGDVPDNEQLQEEGGDGYFDMEGGGDDEGVIGGGNDAEPRPPLQQSPRGRSEHQQQPPSPSRQTGGREGGMSPNNHSMIRSPRSAPRSPTALQRLSASSPSHPAPDSLLDVMREGKEGVLRRTARKRRHREDGEEEEEGGAANAEDAYVGFSARTEKMLMFLKARSAAAVESAAAADSAPSSSAAAAAASPVSLSRQGRFSAREDARGFGGPAELSYAALSAGKPREVAACTFFELLVLKTKGLIDVQQDGPFEDIRIVPCSRPWQEEQEEEEEERENRPDEEQEEEEEEEEEGWD